MEPWFLRPALRHLSKKKVSVHIVADHEEPGTATIYGLFPVQYDLKLFGVPFPHWSVWRGPQSLLGTPLVDRERAREVLGVWLRYVGQKARGAVALVFPEFQSDGAFASSLYRTSAELGLKHLDYYPFERAYLTPSGDAEAHLQRGVLACSRPDPAIGRARVHTPTRVPGEVKPCVPAARVQHTEKTEATR